MTWLIQNLGRIDYVMNEWDPMIYDPDYGKFLAAINLEADDQFQTATWTADPAQALHFYDGIEAFETWLCIDPLHPLRRDGEPNRPLTLWSITIQEVRQP